MGVNQQTSVPAFTAGQVLTAQQQTEINTGVPVFADTTARDAAFNGTGEKVLAEGQLAYLEDSDIVQYYDGAAWATVGPTQGGLSWINTTAFTTVTSVSLPDNTFSASYRNYRIILEIGALTSDADFTMRLRASGADNTTSNYRTAGNGVNSSASAVTRTGNATSSFNMAEQDAATVGYSLVFDLIAPFQAVETRGHGRYTFFEKVPNGLVGIGFGLHFNGTTTFDSLSFISSVASSISGRISAYGYLNG